MTLRRLGVAGLIVLMGAFGAGVYFGLKALRHTQSAPAVAKAPDQSHTRYNLPGTVIIVQNGTLYSLQQGVFKALNKGEWVEPALTPDHQHLIAVKRDANYSDLFMLGLDGGIQKQLTSDISGMVQYNQWSLHPSVSADGQTVFYDYDKKGECGSTGCYQVDLSIFAEPLNGSQADAKRWTWPHPGTGGDTQAIGTSSGGIIYTKFSLNDAEQMVGQVMFQPSPQRYAAQASGQALTPDSETCFAPKLSPDGKMLAVICNPITQPTSTQLMVAPFDGSGLGTLTAVASGFLNSPAWSPDGKSLLYLAPGPDSNDGFFQLFYVALAPPPAPPPHQTGKKPAAAPPPPPPPKPIQVTTDNNFSSDSAPLWY